MGLLRYSTEAGMMCMLWKIFVGEMMDDQLLFAENRVFRKNALILEAEREELRMWLML